MLDRAAEALVETQFRDVAEMLPRFGDRCERVPYVARARYVLLRLQVDAHNVGEASPQPANAGRRAAPDVEDLPGGFLHLCMAPEQNRRHDIGHQPKDPPLPPDSE